MAAGCRDAAGERGGTSTKDSADYELTSAPYPVVSRLKSSTPFDAMQENIPLTATPYGARAAAALVSSALAASSVAVADSSLLLLPVAVGSPPVP